MRKILKGRLSKGNLMYATIIFVQIIILLYWGRAKTNYYIDDLFSLGYASSFTREGDRSKYITTSPDFAFNEWIQNSTLKKYLIVDDNERLWNTSFLNAANRMLTGRMYFGLLNLAESIAGYPYVSAKPAIILNIIIFVFCESALIALMKKLRMEIMMRYLALIMFGCSTFVISAAEYIRFYMLIMLFLILMLIFLHNFWHADKWRKTIINAIGMGGMAYFGYRNSELTIPYFGGLILCVILVSVIARKRKQLVVGSGILGVGIIYIMSATKFIDIILFPGKYNVTTAGRAFTARMNFRNVSVGALLNSVSWVRKLFETHYFGSYRLIFLFCGVVTIYMILVSYKKREIRLKNVRPGIIYAFGVWVLLYMIAKYIGHGDKICLIFTLIIGILGVLDVIGIEPNASKFFQKVKNIRKISLNGGYILVLVGTTVIYTMFLVVSGYLNRWRYYTFGFVTITVILWYVIDRMLKMSVEEVYRRTLVKILTVFVIASALTPFIERKVEFIYEDERAFVSAIEKHSGNDAIVFTIIDGNGNISTQDTYDCINLMSEDTNLYFVDIDKYEYCDVDFLEEFVLWCPSDIDVTAEIKDVAAHGYEMEELGTDHCSKAYICRRR